MTYQVLARKWRPRSFDTLIGQDHVVRALTHALDTQRLHHAWLFTGTRGVGKTTLSRILAKALNCEQGVSATPCGQCRACVEIDQGRFVDYVELDAASNRGVDEMTQLLEQAVYAPSAARYKVYMIDEVHMLTGHAFNAMLKTLEEPPAHVKFILATTDPQKIPVTVLSRCLQFNLKQMTVPAIEQHLQELLQQESIPAEAPALRLLAQAAGGSMRDALSLTDQAIAYSAGSVTTDAVQGMLGTIDQTHLLKLLHAVIEGNGAQLVAIADDMALRGLSFSGALADLAVLLSRIAIQQRVPGALPPDEPNIQGIEQLAQLLSADHVQLFYSVVVHSRDELALAPDEYAGFIMGCMRLLALSPAGSLPAETPTPVNASNTTASTDTPALVDASSTTTSTDTPAPVDASNTAITTDAPASIGASGSAATKNTSTSTTAVATAVAAAAPMAAPEPTVPTPAPIAEADQDLPPWEVAPPVAEVLSQSTSRAGIQPPMIERGGQAIAAGAASHATPWDDDATQSASIASAAPVTAAAPASTPSKPAAPTTASAPAIAAPTGSAQTSAPTSPVSPEAQADEVTAASSAQAEATPPAPETDNADDVPTYLSEPPPYEEPPIDDSAYDFIQQADPDTDFSAGTIEDGDNTPLMDDAVQQAVAALDLPTPARPKPDTITPAQWAEMAPTLALSGWAAELAQQAQWIECAGNEITLRVAIRSADDSQAKARINTVLNEYFGQVLRLHIEYGSTGDETAYAIAQAERAQRQAQAESDVQENPFILALKQQFDAQVVPDSIRAKSFLH